jgi:hypothetical protein
MVKGNYLNSCGHETFGRTVQYDFTLVLLYVWFRTLRICVGSKLVKECWPAMDVAT